MRRVALAAAAGMLTLPAGAWVLAWLGVWSLDATATPPAWEQALARMAVGASVARHAPRTPNPLRPSADVLVAGLKVYREACSGCHGGPLRPSEWGSSDFYSRVPQFARTPPRKPDWQLYWIVQRGVRYSGMAGWGNQIADSSIWQSSPS